MSTWSHSDLQNYVRHAMDKHSCKLFPWFPAYLEHTKLVCMSHLNGGQCTVQQTQTHTGLNYNECVSVTKEYTNCILISCKCIPFFYSQRSCKLTIKLAQLGTKPMDPATLLVAALSFRCIQICRFIRISAGRTAHITKPLFWQELVLNAIN